MPSTLMAGLLYLGARLGLMVIGGWLSSSDQPLFRKKKES